MRLEAYNTTEKPRMNSAESFQYLNSLLMKVSRDISADIKRQFKAEGLIDDHANIRMKAFKHMDPVLYTDHTTKTQEIEKAWSGIKKAETRKVLLRGRPEGVADSILIEEFLKKRSAEKSRQLEVMVTILLHKAFKGKYIVVQASKYDDYFNGVDNVIVNKETGDIICAFDEVRENERSNRREEKDQKILEKAREGGTNLDYGFSISGGTIELKSMSNLPLFCLGLDEDEYDELLNNLTYGDGGGLNEVEEIFVRKLLDSISEQRDALISDPEVQKQGAIMENLNKVDDLLNYSFA